MIDMAEKDERLGLTAQFLGRAKRLGIEEAAHLLWLVPERYIDYRFPFECYIGLRDGDTHLFKGVLSSEPRPSRGPMFFNVTDGDGTVFTASSWLRPYTLQQIGLNKPFYFTATVSNWNGQQQLSNVEPVDENAIGTLMPEYLAGKSKLNRNTIAAQITHLLENHRREGAEFIERKLGMDEEEICDKLHLPYLTLQELLLALHRPDSYEEASRAKQCIQEVAALYAIQLGMSNVEERIIDAQLAIPINENEVGELIRRLPFKPTDDQATAITEIVEDLRQPTPMHRILSGDVGCGKTISYLVPAVAAYKARKQVVILMPNSLLAQQVANELAGFYPEVELVRMAAGTRPEPAVLEGVAKNKPIIVGTTAITHWLQTLDTPLVIDFAIIDEQQKLGLEQKRELVSSRTHFLEATATAIPRSQALIRFGVTKISRINQLPVKKTIRTHFIGAEGRGPMFKKLVEQINQGQQVAILYPRRDGEAEGRIDSVEQAYERWNELFPNKTGWIHGGLSAEEKSAMLAKMQSGEVQVIITSSVIEIGLTLPSLTSMLIVGAERYGASTLHQFRGRIARHGGEGDFYLMTTKESGALAEGTVNRMNMLVNTTDGLEIAEQDLLARGFGDLEASGENQSGVSSKLIPNLEVTPDVVESLLHLVA